MSDAQAEKTSQHPEVIAMQSVLAGYLLGRIDREVFVIREVRIVPPAGFEIDFGSGLRLAVNVEFVDRPPVSEEPK